MPNATSVKGNRKFILEQLRDWLNSGAISEVVDTTNFITNGLTVAGLTGKKPRLCLHSLFVNKATMANLEMELPSIDVLAALSNGEAWLTKLDCKSGFLQMGITDECKHFFGFNYDDRNFRFEVMPWGLASATYYFQKLQAILVDYLAIKGIVAINYIDDLAIIAKSESECRSHLKFALELFASLGYYLSPNKVQWYPSQSMEFLGICLNTTEATLYFSQAKKQKLRAVCNRLLGRDITVNMVQQLLGYLEHLKIGMNFFGPVAHALVADIIDSEQKKPKMKSDFQKITLSDNSLNEVIFWSKVDLNVRERSFKFRVCNICPYRITASDDWESWFWDWKRKPHCEWECATATNSFDSLLESLSITARKMNEYKCPNKVWPEHQFVIIHVRTTVEELVQLTSNVIKRHDLGSLKIMLRMSEIKYNCSYKFVKDLSIWKQKTERVILTQLSKKIEEISQFELSLDLCATENSTLTYKGQKLDFRTKWGSSYKTDCFLLKEIPDFAFCFPEISFQDTLVSYLLTRNCNNIHLLLADRGLRPSWWPLVVQHASVMEIVVVRGSERDFGNMIGNKHCKYKFKSPAKYWLFICSWKWSDFDNSEMSLFKSRFPSLLNKT